MTLRDTSLVAYPRYETVGVPGITSYLINASGEKVAQIFQAPATGSITGLSFKTGTVTASDTLDIRLETVGTDGKPTGTLATTNSNGSQGSLASNTWYDVTLTASHSATKGDYLAWVVAHGGTANVNIVSINSVAGVPYSDVYLNSWHDTGAGYSVIANRTFLGAANYGGTYYPTPGLFPHLDGTTYVFAAQTSTTDFNFGIKFKLPFRARVWGVHEGDINAIAGGNFKYNLWDSDGGTVLDTITIDIDVIDEFIFGYTALPGSVILQPNTWYRLSKAPAVGVQAYSYYWKCASAAQRDAIMLDAHYTQSSTHPPTQESHWLDFTDRAPGIGVLLDQVDDGSPIIVRPRRIM
jgi:hypothetical protein